MIKQNFLAVLALTTLCGGVFGVANEAKAFNPNGDITQPGSIFVNVDFNGITKSVELGFLGPVDGDPTKLEYGLDAPITLTDGDGNTMKIDDLSSVLDPVGTFSVAFSDVGAASNMSATFNFPILPVIGTVPIKASDSLGLTMTDNSPTSNRNGVSITPGSSLNPQTITSYKFYGPNGSAFLPFGLGNFSQVVPPARSGIFLFDSFDNISNVCITLGGCTSYDITVNFLGSGGGDKYAMTGSLEFEPVPEPLTMLGAGTALAFGGLFKRKLAKKKK